MFPQVSAVFRPLLSTEFRQHESSPLMPQHPRSTTLRPPYNSAARTPNMGVKTAPDLRKHMSTIVSTLRQQLLLSTPNYRQQFCQRIKVIIFPTKHNHWSEYPSDTSPALCIKSEKFDIRRKTAERAGRGGGSGFYVDKNGRLTTLWGG